MNTFVTGALFAIGFFVALIALGATIGLVSRWLGARRKEKTEEPGANPTPWQCTEEEVVKKIIRAACDLDLWTRTGRLRGMQIDAVLVNLTDQPEIYPGGRSSFKVRVRKQGGEVLGHYPPGKYWPMKEEVPQ